MNMYYEMITHAASFDDGNIEDVTHKLHAMTKLYNTNKIHSLTRKCFNVDGTIVDKTRATSSK